MSVFDLFRGFFGVPGSHFGGEGRRDPFFDGMTHDDDDDEDDEDEDGFRYDGYQEDQRDPFDNAWRFGFSFGPDGMRIQEPAGFGQVFREMEEIFSQLGRWERQPGSGHFGVPGVMPPPHERPERGGGGGGSSGNSLRDFMLKHPDDLRKEPQAGPPGEPRNDGTPPSGLPNLPGSPFGWTPFSKFHDICRQRGPEDERREDRDLDSAVSSSGLDQILTPAPTQPPSQPRTRSFFQSVTVTKVVKPDGTVEERRTVRDGQGNEKTTVTRSGHPGTPEGHDGQSRPITPPGVQRPFCDMQDDDSLFSKFFGSFK